MVKMVNGSRVVNWRLPLRVIGKAVVLFLLLNLLFALTLPLEFLGRASLYNWLLAGRERLPYGEVPSESYNLSLFNIPAMMASHIISQEKAHDEFRVLVIGDSATWGWFLENDSTLAGQINKGDYVTADGRRVVAYNLGYPIMSLTKDLMFLDAAKESEADLIVWPVTLESFPREKQLFAPIVQNNPGRIRPLIDGFDLQLDPADERFVNPDLLDSSIVGQRRNLADLLRLQLYGFSWTATGIDQAIPENIPLRRSDFEEDLSWQDYEAAVPLTSEELAMEVLEAGVAMAGETPVLIVNEPMFISCGQNSDLRYNSFYPRWAYDQYRLLLEEAAVANEWHYLDIWDRIVADEFTDTPVHLTPEGSRQMAEMVMEEMLRIVPKG
jgi:hypothetical protein